MSEFDGNEYSEEINKILIKKYHLLFPKNNLNNSWII